MVTSTLTFGRNGLVDWLVQRVSAVIFLSYSITLLVFFLCHPSLSFSVWHGFISTMGMRVFSVLALLSFLAHAWFGLWTVFTDSVQPFLLGLVLQVVLIVAFLAALVWILFVLFSL